MGTIKIFPYFTRIGLADIATVSSVCTLPPSQLVILLQIYDGYQSAARVTPGARSAFNVFIVGLQPQLQ